MKLVTWSDGIGSRAGLLIEDFVADVACAYDAMKSADNTLCGLGYLPTSVLEILRLEESGINELRALHEWCTSQMSGRETPMPWVIPSNAILLAPVPHPTSMRDGYAFRQHVESARRNRGLEMIPEWYEAPIFYYSNHLSFRGPFDDIAYPKDSQELDLELEIACVIGREIRNANLEEARAAIFGYSLVNDWTARDFQRFEMKVNMGPTKGKDFATSFGSYIICLLYTSPSPRD